MIRLCKNAKLPKVPRFFDLVEGEGNACNEGHTKSAVAVGVRSFEVDLKNPDIERQSLLRSWEVTCKSVEQFLGLERGRPLEPRSQPVAAGERKMADVETDKSIVKSAPVECPACGTHLLIDVVNACIVEPIKAQYQQQVKLRKDPQGRLGLHTEPAARRPRKKKVVAPGELGLHKDGASKKKPAPKGPAPQKAKGPKPKK